MAYQIHLLLISLGPHPHGSYGGLQVKENPQNSIFLVWSGTLQFYSSQKPKMAIFNTFGSFFRGFWLLVALKRQGRTPNQENRILGVFLDL